MVFALMYTLSYRAVSLVGPKKLEGEMNDVMQTFVSEWTTDTGSRQSQIHMLGKVSPIDFKKALDILATKCELRPVNCFRRFKS